jgi:hypothetical protein
MANKTITIAWNDGSPRFNPPPGVTILHRGDTVTLQLVGVPQGGGSIDAVTIFGNQVVGGKDAKGSELCGWSRSSLNTCTMYGIAPQSDTVVKLTDEENPTEDKKYWFSASGSGPGVPRWEVDPELINKPDGPG